MQYMYILRIKKLRVCAYLRFDIVEEDIEDDANLYHPPRNRINQDISKNGLGVINQGIRLE